MSAGIFAVLMLACYGIQHASSLQCLNEDGEAVDWWLAYSYAGDQGIGLSGNEYAYMDSTMSEFVIPEAGGNNLNKSTSLLMRTMQQIYTDKGHNIAYVFYNDQEDPQGPKGLLASSIDTATAFLKGQWQKVQDAWGPRPKKCTGLPHSKGAAAYDESGGLWLIHNLPKSFKTDPATARRPSLTPNFHHNAQAFLCMSLDLESMEHVAEMLYMSHIKVLQRSEVGLLSGSVSGFDALIGAEEGNRGVIAKGTQADREAHPVFKDLKTQAGTPIKAFAKPPFGNPNADDRFLWQDIVISTLETNLRVQTWRPDGDTGDLPSFCGGDFEVYNVDGVTLKDDIYWKHEHDHAKWGVATGKDGSAKVPDSKKYICVGDINRDDSQRCKGGMAACIVSPEAWSAFTKWSEGQIDLCSSADAAPQLATS